MAAVAPNAAPMHSHFFRAFTEFKLYHVFFLIIADSWQLAKRDSLADGLALLQVRVSVIQQLNDMHHPLLTARAADAGFELEHATGVCRRDHIRLH